MFLVSGIFMTSGILIILWVLFPIILFELYYAPKFGTILAPIAQADVKTAVAGVDYTKVNVWYPAAQKVINMPANIASYTLSIPTLGINNANVIVGGNDLTKSLIHFTGPLPGNLGNPVILGHSTILWFYNPANYKSIFSKLPDLEKGDEIIINSDQVQYTYKVFEMKVTSPSDLLVLSQTVDDYYLTLITCVPQGTYLRRFIVKAKIVAPL